MNREGGLGQGRRVYLGERKGRIQGTIIGGDGAACPVSYLGGFCKFKVGRKWAVG